jgi:tetratricopeptide (TPR) repeat protein
MTTISEALATAIAHCQAGRFPAAEQIFRQILQVEPNYAVAHNNLGNVLQEQGKLEDAVACYRRALELKPDYTLAHSNLGGALQAQGKSDEAVRCYQRALGLTPNFTKAHNNLGVALQEQGKLDQAAACYRRAIQLQPDFVDALNNLGNLRREQIPPQGAAVWNPKDWNAVVVATAPSLFTDRDLADQSPVEEAVACYRRVVALRPDDAAAHNNLGGALWNQGKEDEAAACYRRALQLDPDLANVHCNLGVALWSQDKLDEAVECYQRALQLKPDFPSALNNLAVTLSEQGKFDEAMACCRQALDFDPDYADGHMGLAVLQLLRGDFQQGWPEYEWRWKTKQLPPRLFPQPLWDGGSLAGKTILLHAEQGLGDTFQFVRYAPLVKRLGATVIVECQKPLLPLLATCPGIDRLVGQGDELPEFTTQAPLLSLPRILQTSLDSIPAAVSYLFAAPALIESWRKRLRDLPGFKIGINWQGRSGRGRWLARNIPLRQFALLAEIPGVRLISLQQGAGREELAQAREQFPVVDLGDDVDRASGPFMDTAAIMMSLDLVITSDTAVPNLAGALGVPVWVALPRASDWRWLLHRADSPWYPTMRLFRQKTAGDWAAVFQEIYDALRERLKVK